MISRKDKGKIVTLLIHKHMTAREAALDRGKIVTLLIHKHMTAREAAFLQADILSYSKLSF